MKSALRFALRHLWMIALTGCLGAPDVPECGEVPFAVSAQDEDCGDACDIYCDLSLAQCPGAFQSEALCIDACETEPAAGQRTGSFDDQTGNTVGCRINALQAGGADACVQGSFLQTETCVDTECGEYCDLMLQAPCSDAYVNRDDCMTTCGLIPTGTGQNVNTIECRLRFARQAVEQMDESLCYAASRTGGGVCGGVCESYCGFVMMNCTDEGQNDNEVYDSFEECEAVCALMNAEDGAFDDFASQADTVDCRAYHASQPAADAPRIHCPHTRVYNPMQCANARTEADTNWICSPFCYAAVDICGAFSGDRSRCFTVCEGLDAVQNVGRAQTVELFPQSNQECPGD